VARRSVSRHAIPAGRAPRGKSKRNLMEEATLLKPIVVVIGLLFIAGISALVVKHVRFPYTIGLVLVGIAN